jgi:hypothetical protein
MPEELVSAVCLAFLEDDLRRVAPKVSGRKFPFPELLFVNGSRLAIASRGLAASNAPK